MTQIVNVELEMIDVNILYNACIDIIKEHPEMIGYIHIAKKLQKILHKKL
jgi:hypothetical protein